jgi:hypothetical protein
MDEVEGVGEPEPEGDPASRITPEEEEDLLEAESTASEVAYSGQDFDVIGLIRRLGKKDVLIPTFGHEDERIISAGFQRSFVWTRPQMDRFIESILLGYPIPGIFLIRQADRRYLVLDGQQRLKTLEFFHDGVYDGKEFALQNVANQFKGLTYKTLGEDQRRLFDDTFIQATIVASDGTSESLEAIYQIFERLNSGGTQLTPHEIRVALFAGPFIDFVEKLNKNTNWRALYGKKSPRLRDQELVLRIVALYVNAALYKRPLKAFLNRFVAEHRQDSVKDLDETIGKRFQRAAELLADVTGADAFRPGGSQINAALTEAVFVGLMRRLDQGDDVDIARAGEEMSQLRTNDALLTAVSRATADEERVRARLEITTRAFAGV